MREGPVTWDDFQREFDRKFYTDQMKDRKEAEFHRLVQGGMFVADYEAKFNSLCKFAEPYANDDGRKARKFVKGLNDYIYQQMGLERYEDYSRAVSHALNAEAHEKRLPHDQNRNGKRTQPQQGGNPGGNGNGNPEAPKRPRGDDQDVGQEQGNQYKGFQQRPECPKCGRRHLGVCMHGKCFNCGQKGHIHKNCPDPQ